MCTRKTYKRLYFTTVMNHNLKTTDIKTLLHIKVLTRPFPKGTVPFVGSKVPFGSAI